MVLQVVNHCSCKNISRFVELFFNKEAEIPQQSSIIFIQIYSRLLFITTLVKIYCMITKVFFFPQIA